MRSPRSSVAIAAAALLASVGAMSPLISRALLPISALTFILAAPAWWLVPGTLIAGASSSLIRLQIPALLAPLGQGRIAALVGSIAVFYVVARRLDFRIPRVAVLLASLYTGSVLISGIVASAMGRAGTDIQPDVQRELSQTLAPMLTGLIAFRNQDDRLPALRAFGIVTLLLGIASLIYWAWSLDKLPGVPSFVLPLLENVQADQDSRRFAEGRVSFPFADTDPNSCAAIFALIGALSAAPLLSSRAVGDRVLGAAILLSTAAAIFTTGSRTGVILLVVIGAGYALCSGALWGRARLAVTATILIAGFAGAVAVTALLPEERQLDAQDENVISRVGAWQDAFDDFAASPLIGHGLGHASEARYFGGISVHNEYLQRFVDGGVLSGLAFMSVLGIAVLTSFRVTRRKGKDAGIGAGCLTAAGVMIVSMISVSGWTEVPILQVLSWLTFGVVSATYANGVTIATDALARYGHQVADPVTAV